MKKEQVANALMKHRVMCTIRLNDAGDLLSVVQALRAGDLICMDIAMTTPRVLDVFHEVKTQTDDVILAAASVLDSETARQAILAGADFLVTPALKPDVIEVGHRYGTLVVCGAMTPSEILTAWELGADMVKVFPGHIVGPDFVEAVKGPFPHISLVAGGVSLETAAPFLEAGAAAVCAGKWLVDQEKVASGQLELITERAKQLVEAVRKPSLSE
jgi:2-dehydro-3-deoxyphosphogluconate aldolase/(4S)-4-hydroxy-2-oxoglutarate aldolase